MAWKSVRGADFWIAGDGWFVTADISRVASASNFALILSLCFLVLMLCSTQRSAGARAVGSFRRAICFRSLLSHDNHVVRASSSFAFSPLLVKKREVLVDAWDLGIVSSVAKLALDSVLRTFR